MTGRTARRRVVRVRSPAAPRRGDFLAAEEPLGIRIGGEAFTLTMRTPGDDIDLAAGFLVSEGVIRSAADMAGISDLLRRNAATTATMTPPATSPTSR